MATKIKAWQIVDSNLEPINTAPGEAGYKEEDLEKWIKSDPSILGNDIVIIGQQVEDIDFLGIDKSGNLVVIELKRDKLPREALAQAIDYASKISSWNVDKISEVCKEYTEKSLEEYLYDKFENVSLEDLAINETQRILLVGFEIEEPLHRMIEWLSGKYGVIINAVILKYIKTKNGDEIIAQTAVIPEETEEERISMRRIKLSDEPGNYKEDELKDKLKKYLSDPAPTPQRIRKILLPLCLENEVVTRDMIKKKLIEIEKVDESTAGTILTTISRAIGIAGRDYLRQIIKYEKPNPLAPWEKENYKLSSDYKELVRGILSGLDK